MAHELGHILLHPWSEDIESITREEFKAGKYLCECFIITGKIF
jgi:Zn-dependent peptidase ImmA (M78 family)